MNEFLTDDGYTIKVHKLHTASSRKPPIVFIHALAMDGQMWSGVVAELAVDTQMFALDCRGHGASDKPPGPYEIERFARDVLNLLDIMGCPVAVIVGCSMGGTVAQAFAGLYPDRCAGLVLVDTTAWYGAEAPAAWEGRASKALHQGLSALIEFQVDRWFSAHFKAQHPDEVAHTLQVFLANDVQAYAATCRMLGAADERERLGNYHGPAAVIVGAEDYATTVAMAEDLAARLPASKLIVIPAARHFTTVETPAVIANCIDTMYVEKLTQK